MHICFFSSLSHKTLRLAEYELHTFHNHVSSPSIKPNTNNNNTIVYHPSPSPAGSDDISDAEQSTSSTAAVAGNTFNPAAIKIGEASALPVMLCGLLQKELFYQQSKAYQNQYMALAQASADYLRQQQRNSVSSAYYKLLFFLQITF